MIHYIADLHLDHSNINDKLDKRGFRSVEEMNEHIIKKWNKKISPKDEVIILGDFSFGDAETTMKILKRLNGTKMLIKGNHDKNYLKDQRFDKTLFKWIKDVAEINDNGRKVILSHYPNIFYNGQYRGAYMLYGHIHNTQDMRLMEILLKTARNFRFEDKRTGEQKAIPFNLINCFCMYSNYVPLTLDEWIEISNK